ncbi:UNVERIFIED_ORG: hypothetical protein M2348_001337 [Sphingomonas sp. R1F5B]
MTMFGIAFPGSGGAYGTFETLPSFGGLGYAGHLFGSSLTSTPSANLFESSTAGNALLYGTAGTVGIALSGAAFTGVIAGGVLTVSSFVAGGQALAVGQTVYNSNGVQVGVIASLGTGTGGNGTYNLAAGWVATASSSMTSVKNAVDLPGYSGQAYNGAAFTADITAGVLTVSAFPSGGTGTPLAVGDAIYSAGGVVLGVIASLGTGTGGTGTYNLAAGSIATASTTMYRGTTAGIGGMTSIAVAKGNAGGLVSDYVATAGASLALQLNGGATTAMGVVRGSTTVNSQVALLANPTTQWTMYVCQFTATMVQAMVWRAASGLVSAGATALPTAGAVGSTTNRLQVGRPYGIPNATVAGVAVYRGALTQAQILAVGAAFGAILADVGETL